MKPCKECKDPKQCASMGKCLAVEAKTAATQQNTMGQDPVYKSAGGNIYNNR